MASRTLTEQDRAERRRVERELVRCAVERLRSSEGWRQWLATRSRFHSYSVGNQLLIARQHPDAIRVAGFRAWLALGYCVRKGERAIRIWAPCPPSTQAIERWQQQGADPDCMPRLGWRMAAVFAQDQVAALPPPATPAVLDAPIRDVQGEDLAHLIPSLTALAVELGCTLAFEPLDGPLHGYYAPAEKRIVVSCSLPANAQVKTLCHELAHALVRLDHRDEDPALDYAQEELVAESVAYTCVGTLQISTKDYSIPYLASWAQDAELDVLEQAAKLTDRLATRIESALHTEAAESENAAQPVEALR